MKSSNKLAILSLFIFVGIAALYLIFKDENSKPAPKLQTSELMADTQSPYLTLSDLKGNAVAMDSSKLVFINVWATWCGPCNAEMPSIETLYNRYKSHPKMAFYVVSDEEPGIVLPFLQRKEYKLPFYLYNGAYPEALNGNAIPRTYLVQNGKVIVEQIGAMNWNDPQVIDFIDKQLAL